MIGVGDVQIDQRREPADSSMVEWGHVAREAPWQPPWDQPTIVADFFDFFPGDVDYSALECCSWSWDMPDFLRFCRLHHIYFTVTCSQLYCYLNFAFFINNIHEIQGSELCFGCRFTAHSYRLLTITVLLCRSCTIYSARSRLGEVSAFTDYTFVIWPTWSLCNSQKKLHKIISKAKERNLKFLQSPWRIMSLSCGLFILSLNLAFHFVYLYSQRMQKSMYSLVHGDIPMFPFNYLRARCLWQVKNTDYFKMSAFTDYIFVI